MPPDPMTIPVRVRPSAYSARVGAGTSPAAPAGVTARCQSRQIHTHAPAYVRRGRNLRSRGERVLQAGLGVDLGITGKVTVDRAAAFADCVKISPTVWGSEGLIYNG